MKIEAFMKPPASMNKIAILTPFQKKLRPIALLGVGIALLILGLMTQIALSAVASLILNLY